MNDKTYKQAFSTLHASDDTNLEVDMKERTANRKAHIRPALAVALCAGAFLGCFSTAFAVDAGGIRSAVEKTTGTNTADVQKQERIELKSGDKYEGNLDNGGIFNIEVAKDANMWIEVDQNSKDDDVSITIRDKSSDYEKGATTAQNKKSGQSSSAQISSKEGD